MGHEVCGAHCKCLTSDLVYDPFLCDSCVLFLKENFEHATDEALIRTANDELERHVRKLRRFAKSLEGDRRVKFSKFMDGLRRSARMKVLDMDFFSKLSVREDRTGDDEVLSQVTSVISTQASGSMSNPRPRGSSPGRAMREDMDLLKGQMSSVQEALARLMELPALKAVPEREKVKSKKAKPRSSTKDRGRSKVDPHFRSDKVTGD